MPTDDALTPTGSSAPLAPERRAAAAGGGAVPPSVPDYLRDTYHWAYLSPRGLRIFDHAFVVRAILWGNYDRLKRAAVAEFQPGSRVLQTACVYGDLSRDLADRLGPQGRLDILDVAPIQVQHCRRKLGERANVSVEVGDAGELAEREPYDAICCFFLLHEVPDPLKTRIVDGILDRLKPGGQAVFVDYHRPHPLHPLRPVMRAVFRLLEPFAMPLWRREILSFPSLDRTWQVSKTRYFGGLYQKVVVRRPA